MFWKLLLAILGNLVLVITVLRWDEKLLKFKKGRYSLFIILGFLCMGGTIAVYFDAKESQKETIQLSQQLKALESSQARAARDAEARDDSQKEEIQKLGNMLEPFLIAARNQNPNTDDTTALRSLAKRVEFLEKGRTLSSETMKEIVSMLSAVHVAKVELQVMAGDTESRIYADHLQKCFTEAGWSVDGPILVFDKVFPQGLHIVAKQVSDSPERRAVESALQKTGQPVSGTLNKSLAVG